QLLPVLQTAADHRQFAPLRGAGFLFDQVVLDAAGALRSLEDLRPRRGAFTEGRAVARARRPVPAGDALAAARARFHARDGIGADLEARADVELQDDVFGRARRENVHRALPIDGMPLDLVIVVPSAHAERLQLVRDGRELIAHGLPAVEAAGVRRARPDDVR